MKTPSFTTLGFFLLLTASAPAADKPTDPEGWTTGAAREEIRPLFRHDAKRGPSGKGGRIVAYIKVIDFEVVKMNGLVTRV